MEMEKLAGHNFNGTQYPIVCRPKSYKKALKLLVWLHRAQDNVGNPLLE